MGNLTLHTFSFISGECILVKTSCPHLSAAVNFGRIRKTVLQNGGCRYLRCVCCKTNVVNADKETVGVSLFIVMGDKARTSFRHIFSFFRI